MTQVCKYVIKSNQSMSEDQKKFQTAWVGYDVPYKEIESQPIVALVRKQGVKKRIAQEEHHLTVGYFPEVSLADVNEFVRSSKVDFGKELTTSKIMFDRYGSISVEDGHYVYFSPSDDSATEARFLKSRISEVDGVSPSSATTNLHLSVGGKDPFDHNKVPQAALPQPFSVEGHLVFVGKLGEDFKRFFWSPEKNEFVAEGFKEPVTALPVHTIAIFPKVQVDTIVSIYLLKAFGEEAFPGVKDAKIAFMSKAPEGKAPEEIEREGMLLVDLGGMFDHHRTNTESGKRQDCAATLIASYLRIDKQKYLEKLLQWAKRDDLEGKGTLSEDGLDRAFGLSGIISNLNRELKQTPEKIVELILPLIHHHVEEQRHRAEGLPKLYEELEAAGKTRRWKMKQGAAEIKVAAVECDDIGIAGWLKAVKRMDLVVQRAPTGHTNVITRQERSIDLRPVIERLRVEESIALGVPLSLDKEKLQSVGKIQEVPMWYYDDAANTLQNGGIDPGEIPPTKLSFDKIIDIITQTLPSGIIGALKRRKEKELQ